MDDKITETSDPLALGKSAPNTPHDAFNLWSTVEPTVASILGAGFTAPSQRFADADNTAGLPSFFVVFNAMTSYQVNEHFKLQLNLNNVSDKLYFTGCITRGSLRIMPCRARDARSSAWRITGFEILRLPP